MSGGAFEQSTVAAGFVGVSGAAGARGAFDDDAE
jgi:hypothetical protein